MRYFYIKTQGTEPERAILLVFLMPGDWRKLMLEGLGNIPGPGEKVDNTCLRFCPSDEEADRFMAHFDAGGDVDNFPGRDVPESIVRASLAEDGGAGSTWRSSSRKGNGRRRGRRRG